MDRSIIFVSCIIYNIFLLRHNIISRRKTIITFYYNITVSSWARTVYYILYYSRQQFDSHGRHPQRQPRGRNIIIYIKFNRYCRFAYYIWRWCTGYIARCQNRKRTRELRWTTSLYSLLRRFRVLLYNIGTYTTLLDRSEFPMLAHPIL